jgi:hypothetical protein
MKNFIIISGILLLHSCTTDAINVSRKETISFRKRYMTEPIDSINKWSIADPEILNEDPNFTACSNEEIKKRFETLGLTKNDRFDLKKLGSSIKSFSLIQKDKEPIKATYYLDTNTGRQKIILVKKHTIDTLYLERLSMFEDVYLLKADIINGGYEELIVCQKWYMIDGHNYDFTIFELR